MKVFFKNTFEYTHHCNEHLIEVLLKNPSLFQKKISVLTSHTLNAHHIWNQRIFKVMPALSVWQEQEIGYLKKINNENFEQSVELIEAMQLDEKINYNNSKGQNFTNTVSDIFFHIINHSTYHRGQLISLLKSEGVEPIVTDYIFYKR